MDHITYMLFNTYSCIQGGTLAHTQYINVSYFKYKTLRIRHLPLGFTHTSFAKSNRVMIPSLNLMERNNISVDLLIGH